MDRVREAAKHIPPLVVRPLRGEGVGVKAEPPRKKNFFEALKTKKKSSDDH